MRILEGYTDPAVSLALRRDAESTATIRLEYPMEACKY